MPARRQTGGDDNQKEEFFMSTSTMQQLSDLGQSVWLDFISRPLLETGKLKQLIQLGLRGMTSNPSIFNQSIGTTHDYDEQITLLKQKGKSIFDIYDALTINDIQQATDQFKSVYEQTKGLDGYVSLEINPLLANKVDEQIKEGKRLFAKVNRPNVMIKVPSTQEGFPVIEELIASGINVNVTLIFSLEQYVNTAHAYWRGLKRLVQKTNDLSHVRSVASVFISRVDTIIDELLEKRSAEAKNLKGKAAVANARIIYEEYKKLFESGEFKTLRAKGANVQRVLWGSTSTKNPSYKDVKYVEELIAVDTINTIPEKTLNCFLDHGKVKDAFQNNVNEAKKVISALDQQNILIDDVCKNLLKDGLKAFDDAFETLQHSLEKKAQQLSLAK